MIKWKCLQSWQNCRLERTSIVAIQGNCNQPQLGSLSEEIESDLHWCWLRLAHTKTYQSQQINSLIPPKKKEKKVIKIIAATMNSPPPYKTLVDDLLLHSSCQWTEDGPPLEKQTQSLCLISQKYTLVLVHKFTSDLGEFFHREQIKGDSSSLDPCPPPQHFPALVSRSGL